MKSISRWLVTVLLLLCAITCVARDRSSQTTYVIANDDGLFTNSMSFFAAGGTVGAPALSFSADVSLIGRGIGGGFFGLPRINMLASPSAECVYASNAGTSDIAGVIIASGQLAGQFNPSPTDVGDASGVGILVSPSYVYAAYSSSNTIATFSVMPGCQLSFVDDVPAAGLNGGSIAGIALHGNILVVAYGDGSIESFNVANGVPISNGDAQNSSGFVASLGIDFPEGVDITQDGHYAVFGDSSIATKVEVSDISSGRLATTVLYTVSGVQRAVAPGVNSASIRLSPDQTMVFLGNSDGGSVSAAFFDNHTGKVSGGCTSPVLHGFYNPWAFAGAIITRDTTGNGGVLYVAEYGFVNSYIGILSIASNGSNCTLTESPASEVPDMLSNGLLSIAVYPPRSF